MGKSSKPLIIHIPKELHDTTPEQWGIFIEQGYDIVVLDGGLPDLYLAPYAMRMTGDMLKQLPSALSLAIKGARALRYAPQTKEEGAWKGAKKKGARKGKHVTKQVEVTTPGESVTKGLHQTASSGEGSTELPVGESTNLEGDSKG